MKKIIALLFTFIFIATSYSQQECNYAHYEGTLENGTFFIADLTFTGHAVEGYYYYQIQKEIDKMQAIVYGDWNYLKGKVNGEEISLFEITDGDTTATIAARINNKLEISGLWKAKSRGLESNFEIKPVFPEGTIPFRSYCNRGDKPLNNKPNSPHAQIEMSLLLPDKNVEVNLSALMSKYVIEEYSPNHQGWQGDMILNDIKENFFRQYVAKNKDIHESGFSFNWVKYLNSTIYFNQSGFTTYKITNYGFTGGAHGITRINYLVFDTKDAVKLLPEDIFTEGYEETLSGMIEDQLRELYNLKPDEQLSDGGFFKDSVSPNNNIFLNLKGIGFLYNQYEIAPYSFGQIIVFFSYEELKNILKPGIRIPSE